MPCSVEYKGHSFAGEYRIDFVCFEQIVLEIKARSVTGPADHAQVINYLASSKLRCGLFLNFGTSKLEHKRFIWEPRMSEPSVPSAALESSRLSFLCLLWPSGWYNQRRDALAETRTARDGRRGHRRHRGRRLHDAAARSGRAAARRSSGSIRRPTVETRGGDAIQLKGDKRNLRIEFERQTTNKDGENKLHGVKIFVDNREGRSYTVTGKEAFIGQQNSSFDVRGDVKLETSDGLIANGQQATYVDAEKIVRVPGAVTFKRGRMSGSGIGFTYDEQRDTMWILDKADVKFAAEGNAGAMAFTSGAFGYARRDRYMRLERTLHIDREGQQIDATESTVRLFPDRDEPDFLELRGGSKITGGPNDKAMQSMSATDINIDYADDGRTMQNATLAGNAAIELAPKQGTAGQKLAGNFMDIGLEPDGSVRSVSTRDNVTATLPATKDTAARTIRSTAMTAAGNAQGLNRWSSAKASSTAKPRPRRRAPGSRKAKSLEARLDPGAGTLRKRDSPATSISPTARCAR